MSEPNVSQELIETLSEGLQKTRQAQTRLQSRLRDVEAEANRLKQEIQALENSAQGATDVIQSLSASIKPDSNSSGRNSGSSNQRNDSNRYDDYQNHQNNRHNEQNNRNNNNRFDSGSRNNQGYYQNQPYNDRVAYIDNQYNNQQNNQQNNQPYNQRNIPEIPDNIEPINQRFADRTITQACTLLLREFSNPLHVNDLYKFLVAGGFKFKGKNPTISIAVSLNRNRRFRKVAPGTFDLVMRDASQQAS